LPRARLSKEHKSALTVGKSRVRGLSAIALRWTGFLINLTRSAAMRKRTSPTLLIAVCCLLSGCASGIGLTAAEPIKLLPPPNLTAPPRALPPAASGKVADLEANHLQVTQAYHQLSAQMCGLLKYLEINQKACDALANSLQTAPEKHSKP
jgi:hypothetical protein